MTTEILARIRPSKPRRWFGIATLAGLGCLLIYLAFLAAEGDLVWRLLLIAAGVVSLAGADWMRRATGVTLILTEEAIYEEGGRELCRLNEVEAIERGTFAFKPSNGFLIRLSRSRSRAWAPGLWWRLGRRIGVGGVVPAAQTKIMAEMIEAVRLSAPD